MGQGEVAGTVNAANANLMIHNTLTFIQRASHRKQTDRQTPHRERTYPSHPQPFPAVTKS